MSSSMKNLVRRAVKSCPGPSYQKAKTQMLSASKAESTQRRKERNALPDDFDARTASRLEYAAAKLKFLTGAR